MPRKNRRDPSFHTPGRGGGDGYRPRSAPPEWAELAGHEIRHVTGDKPYICPYCDHPVRPGSWHLVVVPQGDPDARRHWHTECWRKELRRIGAYHPPHDY
jgi:hypothetical protein